MKKLLGCDCYTIINTMDGFFDYQYGNFGSLKTSLNDKHSNLEMQSPRLNLKYNLITY